MKNHFFKSILFSTLAGAMFLTSCDSDDTTPDNGGGQTVDRWITVAGALMQDNAGDGNGGTRVFSVSKADAKNPEIAINVYDNGFLGPSNRTARLVSSQHGKNLFNIAYADDTEGEFTKYDVNGGATFTPGDVAVSIAQYAGISAGWAKLVAGYKTGIAVNVTAPQLTTDENEN